MYMVPTFPDWQNSRIFLGFLQHISRYLLLLLSDFKFFWIKICNLKKASLAKTLIISTIPRTSSGDCIVPGPDKRQKICGLSLFPRFHTIFRGFLLKIIKFQDFSRSSGNYKDCNQYVKIISAVFFLIWLLSVVRKSILCKCTNTCTIITIQNTWKH